MKITFRLSSLLLLGLFGSFLLCANAWTPLTPISNNFPLNKLIHRTRTTTISSPQMTVTENSNLHPSSSEIDISSPKTAMLVSTLMTALIGFSVMAALPEASSAIVVEPTLATMSSTTSTIASYSPMTSALFAYGHYFSIIGIVAILMTERWTLENGPELSDEEENRLAIADALYGAVGLLIVYTGYYRLSDPGLGKGTEFYIHEPVFWLKIAMVGVLGGASLFNTTKIIQRSVARNTGDKICEPMSEALNNRMKSICNAQLTGIIFIPLAATFMARGIGYNESIPWQAEAAVSLGLFIGLAIKYVTEALTFEQREQQQQQQQE